MVIAAKSSIGVEVARKNSLIRTDQDFFAFWVEKTCVGQKLLEKVSGFLVFSLFWLTMNKCKEEDKERVLYL